MAHNQLCLVVFSPHALTVFIARKETSLLYSLLLNKEYHLFSFLNNSHITVTENSGTEPSFLGRSPFKIKIEEFAETGRKYE